MPGPLEYHRRLDDGMVLSLQYVHPNRERVITERDRLRQSLDDCTVRRFESEIRSWEFDDQFYALYTAEIYPREFPDEDIQGLSDRESLIVDALFEAFQTTEKECREQGDPLNWYKQPDVPRLVEEVTETRWRQPIPDVAGCLLSNLIFGHGLPNANHRTALNFVETYLSSFEPEFEIPDTGVHDEWFDWSEEFVHESKRYLMVGRKAGMFRYLENWGCDSIVRKNDIVVNFDEYDIHVDEPLSYYRAEHRELSIEFVYQILERTDYDSLIGEIDPGKRVFLDRLAEIQ